MNVVDQARAIRRRLLLGAGAALVLAGALMVAAMVTTLPGCGGSSPAATAAKGAVLVVSGDTQGWITPCGCTSNQSGGLSRRATYLAALRAQSEVIYADAGGAIDGESDYHKMKFAAILAGEMKMGVAAHNVGGPELRLGVETLVASAKQTGAPLVSACITDDAGTTLFDAIKIVPAGGKRVALVGVTGAPRAGAPAGVRVRPAREAVVDVVARHKGTYDTLVVLAYLGDAELDDLARTLPEADYIVGGPTGQPVTPKRVGPTVIASATRKGKFVVALPLPGAAPAGTAGGPGSVAEMTASLGDEAGQEENVRAFRAALRVTDLPADRTGLAPVTAAMTDTFAGSASCMPCHEEDYKLWKASAHAHAWATLKDRGAESDPSCQMCHTLAYGMPGGFVAMRTTPDRVNVNCEDCHGPSGRHVKEPKIKTLYGNTPRDCRGCHDEENSPKFEKAAFWGKIKHGTVKGVIK